MVFLNLLCENRIFNLHVEKSGLNSEKIQN